MATIGIALQDFGEHREITTQTPPTPPSEISALTSGSRSSEYVSSLAVTELLDVRQMITEPDTFISTEPSHRPLDLRERTAGLENEQSTDQTKFGSSSFFKVLVWWIPELVATLISITALGCMVVLLLKYDRVLLEDVRLPTSLTLNGTIAALATLNRACLNTPVCSALLQQMWLYLDKESKREGPSRSRLRDTELYASASTGAWGSLIFLIKIRASR